MATASEGEELIDIVVRLPRKAIEDTLLAAAPSTQDLAHRRLGAARAVLAGRHRRAAHFRGVRFNDPSWQMMLELYVASCEQRSVAVSQLCDLSGGSMTTALGHIEHLEALGYIRRQTDPDNRRRRIVSMCSPLLDALERWLDLQIVEFHLQDQRLD